MAKSSGTKKKRKVEPKALHCTVCNSQNYHVRKKVKAEYKFEDLSKYCPQCQSHQPHVEKKLPKNN
jgi:ribosomal protein L33